MTCTLQHIGALGLARLATSFFLKDELHLGPAEVASITSLSMLPWVVKPLYGFLTDSVPIFGSRRRSYLVLAGALGCASWVCMGTVVHDPSSAVAATICGSLGVAISDVVADSIVVEKSRSHGKTDLVLGSTGNDAQVGDLDIENESSRPVDDPSAGDLQSLCWGAASVGGILTAYLSGSLLDMFSPQQVFRFTAVIPLLVAAASFLIREEEETSNTAPAPMPRQGQVQALWRTIRDPRIYLPVGFIFLWRSTPDVGSAMFFFNTNDLGFQPEFLGRIGLASNVAGLMGVALYRSYLKEVSVKNVILWTTLASVPLGLTQVLLATHANRALGVPDELFALSDSVVLAALGQVR